MTVDCQCPQEYVVSVQQTDTQRPLAITNYRITFCARCISRWHKYIMGDRQN